MGGWEASYILCSFFFQAEDGIRDYKVTGVQTCALPILEPFPYTDPQRLMSVQIHDTERNEPGGRAAFSGPEFLDYIEQNHVFDRVIANAEIGRASCRERV